MNKIYPIILTGIAGISAIFGNFLLFFKVKDRDKLLAFALGLSFSVMFLISVFELIPEAIGMVFNEWSVTKVFVFSFILLFIGFLVVNYIENRINTDDNILKIGILNMFSLFIHNIPEGIICAITTYTDFELGLKMCFLIMLHNIPEGISISLPIFYATGSRLKAFLYTLISSLGEIFGALISVLFLYRFVNNVFLYVIYMVTAGIMISLSLLKVCKEGIQLKKYLLFFSGTLIGLIIFLFTL